MLCDRNGDLPTLRNAYQSFCRMSLKGGFSNHNKNLGKTPLEGHSRKRLIGTPQHCQGHQKQVRETVTFSRAEGDTVGECHVVSRRDPGTGKGLQVKIKEMRVK